MQRRPGVPYATTSATTQNQYVERSTLVAVVAASARVPQLGRRCTRLVHRVRVATRYPPPYAPTATVLYRTAIVHARSSYRPRPPPPRPTHLQKRSERELTYPEHAVAEKRGSPAPLPPETRPHRTGPDRLELSKHPRPSPTTLDDRYTHPFGSRTRAALLLASLIISLNPLASYHMPAVVASAFPAISIGPPQIRVRS